MYVYVLPVGMCTHAETVIFSESCEFETTPRQGKPDFLKNLSANALLQFFYQAMPQGELLHGCETTQENGKKDEEGGENYEYDNDDDFPQPNAAFNAEFAQVIDV